MSSAVTRRPDPRPSDLGRAQLADPRPSLRRARVGQGDRSGSWCRTRSILAGALACAAAFACDPLHADGPIRRSVIDDDVALGDHPLRGRDLPPEPATSPPGVSIRPDEPRDRASVVAPAQGTEGTAPTPSSPPYEGLILGDDELVLDDDERILDVDAEPAKLFEPPFELDPRQRRRIEAWFRRVGQVEPEESFGALVARSARARLGTPYGALPEPKGEERLTVKVDRLDCLTLVESSNAVARCVWMGAPEASCFVDELRQTRYRDGRIDGYASRLHYFEDWMDDNARRARVRPLVRELGLTQHSTETAKSVGRRQFDFMTQHPRRYPALEDPALREVIADIEARISDRVWPVLPKAQIPDILGQVQDGDIVGFVKGTPGLGVGHTGLVSIDRHGRPRILHATDRSGRVSLSTCDLASCEARRSDRVGIMVMRPLPPPRGGAPRGAGEGSEDRSTDRTLDDALDLAMH